MALYNLDGVGVVTPASGQFWVAPNAVLLGKVKLEHEASVWFGAVLRGDNELITIGERSNVQDGSVLHTDPGFPLTIGADVLADLLQRLAQVDGRRQRVGAAGVSRIPRSCV